MKAIFYSEDIANRIVINGEAAVMQRGNVTDTEKPGDRKWSNYFRAARPMSQPMALAWLKDFGRTDREQRLLILHVLTRVEGVLFVGR